MNIQQMRFLSEVVRHGFNVSKAAKALETSQPNVSMSIQAFEHDLGMTLLDRKDRRIAGLTEDGELIMTKVRIILSEYDELLALGRRRKSKTEQLRIITTHSQARYLLPYAIEKFAKQYSHVSISINQGKNDQIVDSLLSGDADVGLFNSAVTNNEKLVFIPYGTCDRLIIAPRDHPLAGGVRPTLAELTRYPIVIYEPATSNSSVVDTLERISRSSPQVIHCSNTDVVKTYVKRGIGISVVPDFVYNEQEDGDLVAINASHLFPSPTLYAVLKRQRIRNLRIYDFMHILSPSLARSVVDQALALDNETGN